MQESVDAVLEIAPPARVFCPQCGALNVQSPCPCTLRRARAPDPVADTASVKFCLGLYFFLLAACGVIQVVAYVERDVTPREALAYDIASTAVISLTVLIGAATGWRRLGAALRTVGPPKWLLIAPLGACATFAFAVFVTRWFEPLLGKSDHEARGVLEMAAWGWWVPVLLVCVQPAVFEELAFRGLIQGSLANVLSGRDAVLVPAVMFAILHLSPLSFPHLLVTGIALGLLRQRSGSVYPGMILHFCHNGLVVLAAYFTGG
jgi:membrane protease YdiL (CAAX protease family)